MKMAAIYARVSSDQQKQEHTIDSQTQALIAFAESAGYSVPAEWIFEDVGYSGATLVRPGLERVRDLAAERQIQAVLALAPDRLSRKYAYQVLLIEELARHGVAAVFVKAPTAQTPEDHLLLQFQGMIAEYERAQILERSRRGKRHRAKLGEVSVLSQAPYGYRYVRRTDEHPAYFEVIEVEAQVVRQVFDLYTKAALSLGAVTRRLNELGVPTRKGGERWGRSMIWTMLRNSAYQGKACFGKTQSAPRKSCVLNRTQRLQGRTITRENTPQELPEDRRIEIPVPSLVDELTFALAQERLKDNKIHAPRRTIEPSILQGIVHCSQCGYALFRDSARTSARTIYYYRCPGSEAWRFGGKARCDQRAIRLDLLEHVVWSEIMRLLEDPAIIESELQRRLDAACNANPTKRDHQEQLARDMAQLQKRMERLLTAYQEDLLSLDELRHRMPELRRREQHLQAELQSLNTHLADQSAYLRLAHTLTDFLARMRTHAQSLDVRDRQQVIRLLVKDVVIGKDSITIRHSIPSASPPSGSSGDRGNSMGPTSEDTRSDGSFHLRPWRVQHVAGPTRLARVVAQLGAFLPAVQRLDAGIDVEHPGLAQRLTHRVHQRWAHPGRALRLVDALERPAQRVLADHLVHAQRLSGHRVAAQRGDVGVTPVPSQQAQHQRAQHVALVRGVAAAVLQRAGRHPALEHARGGQKLSKEDELAVRRCRRASIPAHVHAPAQRVHRLELLGLAATLDQGPLSLASRFTHWVSLPNHRFTAPSLASRGVAARQLPFLG